MSNQTCPASITGAIPQTWHNATSSSSIAACSVPTCGNNTAILATCCGAPDATAYSNFTSADNRLYTACMLRNRATAFRCNDDDDDDDEGVDVCPDETPGASLPADAPPNSTSCLLLASNPNATQAFAECGCDGPRSLRGGCFQECVVVDAGFTDCLIGELGRANLSIGSCVSRGDYESSGVRVGGKGGMGMVL